MKQIYLSILTLTIVTASISAFAQTTWEVEVVDFSFTPANLDIEVGDIVIWTNTQGFHNVGTSAFPDNAEDFGNAAAASPWTYEHTFTEVGSNEYHCDIHPGSMVGSVNVSAGPLSTGNIENKEYFSIYPNPASDVLRWKWMGEAAPNNATFTLYDITGKKVAQFLMSNRTSYDVSHLGSGMYHYEMDFENLPSQTGKVMIDTK